ncbi:hypothetical protein [Pseudomonas sp. NPDC087804]|uniref:DUF7657 domain-containing protein n=1 Tax=Pseudomonas sp. NPDC087804 TaxID=3364449 RepID=UPI0038000D0B
MIHLPPTFTNSSKAPFRLFLFIVLIFNLFIAGATAAQAAPHNDAEGFIDALVIKDEHIAAQGWIGATQSSIQIVSLAVWIDEQKISEGPFERFERPDVVQATSRADWLRSGWRVNIKIPDDIEPGSHTIKVVAKLDTGKNQLITGNESTRSIIIPRDFNKDKTSVRLVKLLLLSIFLTLVITFIKVDYLSAKLTARLSGVVTAPQLFGFSLILAFIGLVGIGITGSSLNFGLAQAPTVEAKILNIAGQDRGIRSDEWLVLTPLAIAQYNHQPANPVVNSNHGEDGQNMLIVGMAGVPVAHISAIAKPATWGYFVFDLKRALSWNWLFPVFSCLIALWAVLCVLIPGQWRANFLLSLLFSTSPYVVAWSNWPAYAVFFPSVVFLCANYIIRHNPLSGKLAAAVLMGIAFSGFVFVLYPPWQVSLGYIYLALIIGLLIKEKLYRNFDKPVIACIIISLVVSAAIIIPWWLDARTAIQAMENTVYPGQRTTVVGGTMSLSTLLRGFTNLATMQGIVSPYSNESEIASFYYLLLPLAFLFAVNAYRRSLNALECALALAIVFILVFMFWGVPTALAKYSFWGRVPANRADLALGLSCIILTGLLFKHKVSASNLHRGLSLLFAAVWTYIIYRAVNSLDDSILATFSPNVQIATMLVTLATGYFLAVTQFKNFIALSLGLTISTTLTFNPINIAPEALNNKFIPLKTSEARPSRILVLENMTPAMYLVASGNALANGIYYYPQSSLWKRLDIKGTESNTYNRYQHLTYLSGQLNGNDTYIIETPRPDVVVIRVDLEKFDFKLSGATTVAAPVADRSALDRNSSLSFIRTADGWSWFDITEK